MEKMDQGASKPSTSRATPAFVFAVPATPKPIAPRVPRPPRLPTRREGKDNAGRNLSDSMVANTEPEIDQYVNDIPLGNILTIAQDLTIPDVLTIADDLEDLYTENRIQILNLFEGNVPTPLSALHELSRRHGARIHVEYHEARFGGAKRIMTEIFVGLRRGIGEARTKKLAAHMAAVNILRQIDEESDPDKFEVPPYYLIPGCRIPSTIFKDLQALCSMLELTRPLYISLPPDPEDPEAPLYMFKCQIGRLICVGESDTPHLAKRIAARETMQKLTGENFPLDYACCGRACMTFKEYNIMPLSSNTREEMVEKRVQIRAEEAARKAAKRAAEAERKDAEDEANEASGNDESQAAGSSNGSTVGAQYAAPIIGIFGEPITTQPSAPTAQNLIRASNEDYGFGLDDEYDRDYETTEIIQGDGEFDGRIRAYVENMTEDAKNKLAELRIV